MPQTDSFAGTRILNLRKKSLLCNLKTESRYDSEALVRMLLCHLLNMNKNPSLSDQASLSGSLLEALRDFGRRCEAIEFVEQDIDHEFEPVACVSIPYMCESEIRGLSDDNHQLVTTKGSYHIISQNRTVHVFNHHFFVSYV